MKTLRLDSAPWERDVFWLFADFLRTSPDFNPHYPYGFDCRVCEKHGIECTCDCDGWECNFAIAEWLKGELLGDRTLE